MRGAPYSLAAALILVRFADEWATFLPSGALEPIRHDLGLSYAAAAGVLVALPAGGILGNVFVVAADHVSRRWLASLGALAYGLSMIVFGLAHSLATLLVAAFVWGAASDAFIHGCEVALVDLAGADLPRALARLNAWSAVGDLLGPLTLAAASVIGVGWRGAFLGLGALVLAYAAWIATLPLPPPHAHAQPPGDTDDEPRGAKLKPLAGVWAVMRDRQVLFLALVLGLYGLLDEPLLGFLIAYLERVRHLSPALANAPVFAILIGGMAGFAAFERLVGAQPSPRAILGAAVVVALSLAVTLFAPWLALQIIAASVFGAAGAVFYTTLGARTLALRPGLAGATSAVVSSIGMVGIGFPALVGLVADRAGLGAGVALYALIPLAILALLIAGRRKS